MKLVCVRCGTIAEQGTRWCSNIKTKCPPGTLSLLLDAGETVDDIQITKLWRVFPMAALYRAKRGKQSILLKVAHRGFEENLKREAHLLASIGGYPTLPKLVPNAQGRSYFKSAVSGEVKYCAVYESADGVFLDEILLQMPQPPLHNAARLVIQLADVLALLHVKYGKLVLNQRPDSILVRRDRDDIFRPVLFDLGFTSDVGAKGPDWFLTNSSAAYAAPESLRTSPCGPPTDVYGLGLLLYEMFSGQPAVPHHNCTHDQVREAVIHRDPAPLSQRRPELAQPVLQAVQQAIQKTPQARQPDVRTFAKQLRVAFGEVPTERTRFNVNRRAAAAVLIGLFVCLMIFLLIILIQT